MPTSKNALRALLAAAALTLLAGCGGGADPGAAGTATTPQATRLGERLHAAALTPTATAAGGGGGGTAQASVDRATDTPEAAADRLLDSAERQFPEYFPSPQPTQGTAVFRYRHYPQTGIYLGVVVGESAEYRLDGVYVAGGPFGDKPMHVGARVSFVDTDGDGSLDADDIAPYDAACAVAQDAEGSECIFTLMTVGRTRVVGQSGARVYFSAEGDSLMLYAYDLDRRHFVARRALTGFTPTAFAYSADHARLYVGDDHGNIHAYSEDLAPAPAPFAKVTERVTGLAAAGKHLVAQDTSGAWGSHHVFDRAGTRTDTREWRSYSSHFEWSVADARLYYFQDEVSPNDLLFEVIDPVDGRITSQGETPYHGAYSIRGPIRATRDGSKVLLGSGDLYAAPALTWAGRIAASTPIVDALWRPSDELLVATRAADGRTRLQRVAGDRSLREDLQLDGELLAFITRGDEIHLLLKRTERLEIRRYQPSDDSDGDGIDNRTDRFPTDPAAAADSDSDGHPDAWLPGRSAADSTTGLTLDVYPQDASCHATAQGNGARCDPALAVPPGVPDLVVSDGQGRVFLLSRETARVYRWAASAGGYVAPLVVGQAGDGMPQTMAYSSEHHRLYLGYANGRITCLETAGSQREQAFGVIARAVDGLATAGKYLLAQDASGAWATHYVFDSAGALTAQRDWNYFSRHYAWAPNQSRVYFFRDGSSPNDLMWEEIDQTNGQIAAAGESPYHGDFALSGPLRVSLGGGRIVVGSGVVFTAADLTITTTLAGGWTDMQWLSDGRLVTVMPGGDGTQVTVYSSALKPERELTIAGTPVALAAAGVGSVVVFTHVDGALRATRLTP